MVNSVDPDETARYKQSNFDIHCLLWHLCWSALSGWIGGWGWGEVTGVIVVRVCEPVFKNLPHSYTCPLKKTDPFIYLIIQNVDLFIYCPLFDILYPFCFAGC